MLYQLSYEATHWERGQFIEFISSREEWNFHLQPQFINELFRIYITSFHDDRDVNNKTMYAIFFSKYFLSESDFSPITPYFFNPVSKMLLLFTEIE